MKRKLLCLLLALLMLLPTCVAFAEDGETAAPASVVAKGFWSISKYGNVKLNLSHAEVLDAFDFGDVLTVTFADKSVDVPLCINYSDVDTGCASLALQMDGDTEETVLNINMFNFAETYGIAKKIVHEDKSYDWEFFDGITDELEFTITLKEKAGYLAEFTMRSMVLSNLREDYPELSDAEFANFRMVTAGEIGEGILYRSATPVDPKENRNSYSDAAARAAGVTVFVDLNDREADLAAFPGEAESYFATQKHVAVAATLDLTSEDNQAKQAEALRFMAANRGVYDIFCLQGKDRTGILIALLECLMGADFDEITADYMVSYYNYYGITAEDPAYALTVDGNLRKNLQILFGADPEELDLRAAAEEYIYRIGLTGAEIDTLKRNLRGFPFSDVKPTDEGYAEIEELYYKGVLAGKAEDLFAPADTLSRAMAVTMLWRLAGKPYLDYALSFRDVRSGEWYTPAVRWAAAEKIVEGYAPDCFAPTENVTREQLATILYRYAKAKGLDPDKLAADTNTLSYTDVFEVSDWAAPGMHFCLALGIVTDENGMLYPANAVSRVEAACMVQRFCEAIA